MGEAQCPAAHVARRTVDGRYGHGVGDTPQSQASLRFVDALRREYKPVTYRTYPGECYYVRTRANLRRMYLDIAEFFDQHLREP